MEMQLNKRRIIRAASIVLVVLLLAVSTVFGQGDSSTTMWTRNGTSSAIMSRCRPGKLRPELAVKCWLAVFEVPACLFDIVEVFFGGSVFNVGRACCHAFIDLTDDCKIEVFQRSKLFPAIENFCAGIGGGSDAHPPPPTSAPCPAPTNSVHSPPPTSVESSSSSPSPSPSSSSSSLGSISVYIVL